MDTTSFPFDHLPFHWTTMGITRIARVTSHPSLSTIEFPLSWFSCMHRQSFFHFLTSNAVLNALTSNSFQPLRLFFPVSSSPAIWLPWQTRWFFFYPGGLRSHKSCSHRTRYPSIYETSMHAFSRKFEQYPLWARKLEERKLKEHSGHHVCDTSIMYSRVRFKVSFSPVPPASFGIFERKISTDIIRHFHGPEWLH